MQNQPAGSTAEIDRLEQAGDVIGALDAAISANRAQPSIELQRRLVDLRHRASVAYQSTPRSPWPLEFDDPFPDVGGDSVPEIPAAEFDSRIMGAAIAHHGSLIVRGLFDADRIDRTQGSIHQAFAAARAEPDQRDTAHFDPVLGLGGMTAQLRNMVVKRHGIWLGDSPAATAQVLDDLADVGVVDAVAEHFGERPVISLEKSTLRNVQPEFRFAAWHQDGSFLGPQARALNVWIALSSCGGDRPAPGLELVAGRVPKLFPLDGTTGNASIDGLEVHLFAKEKGFDVIRPEFEPGDALLFDELMAHRTHLTESMDQERLALECWFFAPSNPAEKYVFMLV